MSTQSAIESTDVLAHIDGEWISGPEQKPNINPADTREIIGMSAHCGRKEAVAAIEAAERALPGWRETPAPKRGNILFEAVRLMKERAEVLAMAMCREEGKTLHEARGEVQKSIIALEFNAGEGRRPTGQVVPSEMGRTFAYHVRQPLGVVSIITPWNFCQDFHGALSGLRSHQAALNPAAPPHYQDMSSLSARTGRFPCAREIFTISSTRCHFSCSPRQNKRSMSVISRSHRRV
jgi:delta 1-pyrroline-5-carboxylate dehydrogenase